MEKSNNQLLKSVNTSLYIAWTTALAASFASIYFIEILGKPAASLCWFERMLMFGLLLVLTVGIYYKDQKVKYYCLPFLFFGIPSAAYQQLIHWNIIKMAEVPCSLGSICTVKYFELFGFITQATLCLSAFIVIAVCLWFVKIKN